MPLAIYRDLRENVTGKLWNCNLLSSEEEKQTGHWVNMLESASILHKQFNPLLVVGHLNTILGVTLCFW